MTMSDNWHTIRVPPEAYEQAKAQKEANGRTWGEQLVRPEEDGDSDEVDELVDAIRDELNADSDTEAIADAVADRVDTPETVRLDASERRKIAEEVAGELR